MLAPDPAPAIEKNVDIWLKIGLVPLGPSSSIEFVDRRKAWAMTKKGDGESQGKEKPEPALTDEEAIKKYPKQKSKLIEPEEPPPPPRSTDPRRKQR